jgi:hypothetical protein
MAISFEQALIDGWQQVATETGKRNRAEQGQLFN